MATVIPVKFAYAARELWFDPKESDAQAGDHVICSTERGTEIGLATADPHEVSRSELGRIIGNATLKPVLRVATDDDLERADKLAQCGEDALPLFRKLVAQSGLDMKPVGVEYLFGREKVVCYFAAEERVDFRLLVRELSRELHERIDMRQIGVREEAAFVGGFGHCGQELCCARFGLSFEPVSIRMAKEQDLPLTSNKISGACGRLMCCLRYEFEAYRDFKSRAPKRNALIDTPLGMAKVIEYDTPKEQLALRIESGKVVRIPLAEMVTSEAAVKKSEELNCPCRPDTVVRASLEKLSSPDVQMALAELDRKMGVVVDDGFDDADLFVESKPPKRRNRAKERAKAAQATPAHAKPQPEKEEQDQPSKRTRRRRRRRSDAESATTPSQPKHMAPAKQAEERKPSDSKPSEATTTRRRRRHRSSASAPQTSPAQPQARAQAEQKAEQAPQKTQRPKRRPGDRAGQQQATQKPSVPMQAAKPSTKPATKPEGQADGTAPKRRRRRRRRTGGSSGDSGQQGGAE